MLQSASDWWYGTEETKANEPNDTQDNNENPENTDTDDESDQKMQKLDIKFEKNLQCISSLDPIISMFKLINFEKGITALLSKQFENKLTEKETNVILSLFVKIYQMGIASHSLLSLYTELKIGEIILSYFASLSPTNPPPFECFDRWIKYRMDKDIRMKLNSVDNGKLLKFYETNSNQIGFGNKGRLIWFVSTEKYDGYIDDDTQRKGVMLLIMSFFWDLRENKFNLHTLRHGILSHINLSHWSMTQPIMSWSTVYAIKDNMVAFPYALKDIFILNPPMFVYLVKTAAAQFFNEHSLEKFVFLEDQNEFFQKYASKEKTPILADGTIKMTVTQWMQQRGYI